MKRKKEARGGIRIKQLKQINKMKTMRKLIEWNKIEEYWDKLTTKDKKRILSLDDFADADYYKDYDFNSLPTDVQNNLLKFLPKFEK